MKARYRILFFLAGTGISIISGYGCLRDAAAQTQSVIKPQATGIINSNTATATTYEIRVIEKGDTLYKIAQDEGTTVKVLLSLNKLRNSRLQIGQKLKIPPSPKTPPETKTAAPPKTLLANAASAPDAPEILEAANTPVETDDPVDESLRLRLVKAARELLGTRYRWAGVSATTGFDCSGLVQKVFSYFDIELPRSSKEQFKVGEKINKDELEAGDLVFPQSQRGRHQRFESKLVCPAISGRPKNDRAMAG
jgi:cell wall-associated NlpC family hydrolase